MNNFVDSLEFPVLTKSSLVDLLVDQMGINGRESCELVEVFFDLVLQRLSKGEDVKLAGFGNFEVHKKGARPGRNPRTGQSVVISPRKVVKFSPGPKFKRRMMEKRLSETLSVEKSGNRVIGSVPKPIRPGSTRPEQPRQPAAL